jgi:hypothetical protein
MINKKVMQRQTPRLRLQDQLPTCKPALCERETAFVLAFPESFPALPPACGAQTPDRGGGTENIELPGRRAPPPPRRVPGASASPRPAGVSGPPRDARATPPAGPRRAPSAAARLRPPAGPQRRCARHPTVAARREIRGCSVRSQQNTSPRSSKSYLRAFPTVTSFPSPCVTGFSPAGKNPRSYQAYLRSLPFRILLKLKQARQRKG